MIYLVTIIIYLCVLTGVAIYRSRQVHNQADFAVAGRKLSPWVMVLTMVAVWIGTGSILGNAEEAYNTGLATTIVPLGGFLGMVMLAVVATRARNVMASSVPEVIGGRFGGTARGLSVIALIMAYMVIVSYQFNAGGAVLEVITANEDGIPVLDKHTATFIAAAFIITFTMLAGLMSLAYMDVITGLIILVTVILAFPLLLMKAGGIEGMEQAYAEMGKTSHMQFWGVYSPVHLVNYLLPPFLLVMGDANQYQRIFASRNARGAKHAVITLIFVSLGIELLIVGSAWVAGSMTSDEASGRYILIHTAAAHLPFLLGLLFMVAVVGIITSTANSFLLVPATSFINDVYINYINPNANEKRLVFMSRLLVLTFGVIGWAVTFAFEASTGFFEKALYAYTIYGAAITPSLVAALFWDRATKAGAIASILTGTVVTLVWSEADALVAKLPGNWSGLDAVLPAIILSIIALVGVSLLTKPTPPKPKAVETV